MSRHSVEPISVDSLPIGKYLVLIPHSDDEWIGCSSIIQDERNDVVLCNMNMPGNDSTEIHAARRMEMERIAQRFSRRLLLCEDHSNLTSIIKTERPASIVVPYFIDWHDEHIGVMRSLYNSLSLLTEEYNVVMCQITVPISSHNITHATVMNKASWKNKWFLFRNNYFTQKYFPWYRIACHERLNGLLMGEYAAEVFCSLSSNQWKNVFSEFCPSSEDRRQIKSRIVSIELARGIMQENVIE